MRNLRVSQILAIAVFAQALVACAPPTALEADDGAPGGLTGYADQRGSRYTVGGDPRLLDKNKPKPNQPAAPVKKEDQKLAEDIQTVSFTRLSQNQKTDRLGTANVKVILGLKSGGQIEVNAPLKATTAGRFQSDAVTDSNQSYQITVDLTDDQNRLESQGTFVIKKLTKGKPVAQTTIYTRSYAAKIFVNPSNQKLNSDNQKILKLLSEDARAWVTNSVVERARSFYEVHLFASEKNKQPDIAGIRLFWFFGEAKRADGIVPLNATAVPVLLKPLTVEMLGDAEVIDERTYAVVIEGEGKQNVDVALRIEKYDLKPLPQVANGKTPRGITADSFFRAPYGDKRFPEVTKTIDDFERNYNLPIVQTHIKKYSANTPGNSNLRKLLEGAFPVRDVVTNVFLFFGVAPSAAVVTWLESQKFYYDNSYPIEINQTAVGPFQLVQGTAKGYGLRISEGPKNHQPPAWDERRYYAPSACASAKLFRDAFSRFGKQDATLIILGYRLGNDGTEDEFGMKNSPARKYNLTFREIAEQRIGSASIREYVAKALALYFVTGNPTQYGISYSKDREIPRNKVIPNNGITDSQCSMAMNGVKLAKAP